MPKIKEKKQNRYVRMSSEDFKAVCDVLFNDDKYKPLVSYAQQTRKTTLRIY